MSINQPSNDAIRRIQQTVRTVERMPQDQAGQARHHTPARQGFWARLDPQGMAYNIQHAGPRAYSWEKVVPMPGGVMGLDPEGLTGEASAVNTARVPVPPQTIVFLHFVGMAEGPDGGLQPQYVFTWDAGHHHHGVGIHDHRDNYNGGYAFSVYAPGTAIPQQPWAL